jgi:chaperonin cofactor prefoldin
MVGWFQNGLIFKCEKDLSCQAKLIYFYLCEIQDRRDDENVYENTGKILFTADEISKYCNMSLLTAKKAVNELKRKQYLDIKIIRYEKNTFYQMNTGELCYPGLKEIDFSVNERS